MAATLTAGDEMTRFSFPIGKTADTGTVNPVDGTPDLEIWGKVTDGTLDSDLQVVDPDASLRWIKTWFDTKANIRLGHDPHRPVGRGVEVDGHHVKGLIADPVAKHLVRTKVLNDWSISICLPDIRVGDPQFAHLDPAGKAVRGVITDRPDGKTFLGEISIVDRGSNYGTAFQLVKAAADGTPEFTGKMITVPGATGEAGPDVIKGTVSFSPGDLAKLLEHRRVAEEREEVTKAAAGADEAGGDNAASDQRDEAADADMEDDDDATDGAAKAAGDADGGDAAALALKAVESAVWKRDVSAEERRRLAKAGHALADGSYPIADAGDLENAAVLARSGHGDVGGARALIARRAADLKVPNPLDAGDASKAAGTADGGDTARAVKPAKVPCPECEAKCKPGAKFCGSCGGSMTAGKAASPSPADGVTAERTEPVPAHREPDGVAMELLEDDAHLEGSNADEGSERAAEAAVAPPAAETAELGKAAGDDAAAWQVRAAGAEWGDGVLHDLTCPAFSPDATAKCYPGLTLAQAADPAAWQRKALDVAVEGALADAQKAQRRWQDAVTLAGTDAEVIAGLRWEAHKAFADANPGPATYPAPSEPRPQSFRRPALSGGGQAATTAASGTVSAHVPSGQVSAAGFQRGPLTDGQSAPSAGDGASNDSQAVPAVNGRPQRTFYRNTSRDGARSAMASMHDHIAQTFPDLCPVHGPGYGGQAPAGARPVPVPGARKAAGEPDVTKAAPPAKGRKMSCPECGKKSKAGRAFCFGCGKKMTPDSPDGAAKSAPAGEAVAATIEAGPDIAAIVKAAVTEATAPLTAKVAEQGALIDQMAAAPDPRYAPFKAVAAGGILPKAAGAQAPERTAVEKAAGRVQETLLADLQHQARNDPDPAKRETAWNALSSLLAIPGASPLAG